MKNFIDTAIGNKLGVWKGYAQVSVGRFNHIIDLSYKHELHYLLNSKTIQKITEENSSSFLFSKKEIKKINQIRIADIGLENSYGILVPIKARCSLNFFVSKIDSDSQFLDKFHLYYNIRFDKKFNVSGVFNIEISLTPESVLQFNRGAKFYSFEIKIERRLVDICLESEEVLLELKRRLGIY